MLRRTNLLLQHVNSTIEVDSKEFEKDAKVLFKTLNSEYKWKKQSPALHRLLVHGKYFIDYYKTIGILLGSTSESAIETRNRANKTARLNHARKTNRLACITDTFNWLLATCDPYMSEKRRVARKKRKRGRKPRRKEDKRRRRQLFRK